MSRTDQLQPLILLGSIALGLGLAALSPSVALAIGPVVSVGVFALIFLAMLGLDLDRVTGAFAQRRFLLVAIFVNFVVNPLVAWGLAEHFLKDDPALHVGLILFLVTPCIGWYLLFTEMAGGDVGLGVSLLGMNLVLQVLLLPVYLLWFTDSAASVGLGGIGKSVGLFLVLPGVCAAATRLAALRGHADLERIQHAVERSHLKTFTLILIIVAMFASQADVLRSNPGVVLRLLPPMLIFFAAAFAVALLAGALSGFQYEQTVSLVFTATSRNSEASLAIAATAFASPLVALTVVIGPVIELPLLVLMARALLGRRRNAVRPERTHLVAVPGEN